IALKRLQQAPALAYQSVDGADINMFTNAQVIHNTSGNGQVFLSVDQGIYAYKQLNGNTVLDNNKKVITLSEGGEAEENLYYSLLKALEDKSLHIDDTLTIQNVYY